MIKLTLQILAFYSLLAIINGARLTIFKGTLTNVKKFPFIAALRSSNSGCTGSLVSSKLVITAAHCLCKSKEKEIKDACFLRNYFYTTFNCIAVSSYVHDPKYPYCESSIAGIRPEKITGYDLAFARITMNALTIENVKEVQIDMINQIKPGTKAIIMGYGMDRAVKINNSEFFKIGHVKTTKCPPVFDLEPICVEKSDENVQITGPGDSGGPLFLKEEQEIVGVLSGLLTVDHGKQVLSFYGSLYSRKEFIESILKDN